MDDGWCRREVQLANVRVSVLERTSGDEVPDAPILLLHGLIAEADTFRKLMVALPRNRRILALDLPGAGYSERSAKVDSGFAGMADIVAEAATTMGLKRPVVIGHSHGGAVALQLATRTPDFVSGLILLCPAHPFSGRETPLVRFYLSRIGRAFAHTLPHFPDWLHLFVFRHMPGGRREFSHTDLQPYLHTLRWHGTVDHLLELLKSWEADMARLREKLTAEPLAVPTLMLWGDQDAVVPLSSAAELTRHLLECKLVAMRNVGHLPNEEAPKETAEHIIHWLTYRQDERGPLSSAELVGAPQPGT